MRRGVSKREGISIQSQVTILTGGWLVIKLQSWTQGRDSSGIT
jgi:hypothetical protein